MFHNNQDYQSIEQTNQIESDKTFVSEIISIQRLVNDPFTIILRSFHHFKFCEKFAKNIIL